jgi:Ca-activated chloride channel homolog
MILEQPIFLLGCLLALPAVWLFIRAENRSKKRLALLADSSLQNTVLQTTGNGRRRLQFIVLMLGFLLGCVAASGPMLPGGEEKIKVTGIDVVVALDVSNSMLAEDISPSRLERAKLALNNLLLQLEGDRLGIVLFAGKAYTGLPLTDDKSAAQMVIESVSTGTVEYQGTAVGAAIDQAAQLFYDNQDGRGKAIIVISDGENHEDNGAEAATRAVEKGIIVNTIGIGSSGGASIPEFDENGNTKGFKRDAAGSVVTTRLNEAELQKIAAEGKGMYVRATSGDVGVGKIFSALQNIGKSTKEIVRYTKLTPLAVWFLGVAFLLLIADWLIPVGAKKRTS